MRITFLMLAIGLLATPAMACEFKAANGSTVQFVGPEEARYALIDGKKCSFTDKTFTCGGHTTHYQENWDRFIWKGVEYVTTDNCALVE